MNAYAKTGGKLRKWTSNETDPGVMAVEVQLDLSAQPDFYGPQTGPILCVIEGGGGPPPELEVA